jgi:hypothetical protein
MVQLTLQNFVPVSPAAVAVTAIAVAHKYRKILL